ncbi:MAG: ATP synthase F0 subunit C [Candidatus Omnitrophica bacterium]|nr:ATP synthase F0 subunit C [Candidatus Omnitrophota bacterium]
MSTVLILLVLFAAILGPSIVIASIGFSTIKALGRNPSAAPKIFLGMIIMVVFAEAIAIIALLVVFQLFGK